MCSQRFNKVPSAILSLQRRCFAKRYASSVPTLSLGLPTDCFVKAFQNANVRFGSKADVRKLDDVIATNASVGA